MSLTISDTLSSELTIAHQIVETVVLRTTGGAIFTIEIGQALSSEIGPAFGAKVTHQGSQSQHVGICQGESIEEAFHAAQQMVAQTMQSNGSSTAIPKPHIKAETRATA